MCQHILIGPRTIASSQMPRVVGVVGHGERNGGYNAHGMVREE